MEWSVINGVNLLYFIQQIMKKQEKKKQETISYIPSAMLFCGKPDIFITGRVALL